MIRMSTVCMIITVLTATTCTREKRIPYGERVKDPGRYPFLVSVRTWNYRYICPGYLTELSGVQVVITAANCLYGSQSRKIRFAEFVRAGTISSQIGYGVARRVSRIFILKDYLRPVDFIRPNYDLAILLLVEPYNTDGGIKPVHLETVPIPDPVIYKDCDVMGWGGPERARASGPRLINAILTRGLAKIQRIEEQFISVNTEIKDEGIRGIIASSADYGGPLECRKRFLPGWHVLGTLSVAGHAAPLHFLHYYTYINAFEGNFNMIELISGEEKLISKEEFPFVVSLRDAGDHHRCGGFLTKPNIVITTADCLFEPVGRTVVDVTSVRIGIKWTPNGFGEKIPVKSSFVHRHVVSPSHNRKDVGYLQLEKQESSGLASLPIECEPVSLDEFYNCEILFFGGDNNIASILTPLPNGIKVFPYLRKLPGRIVSEHSGVIFAQVATDPIIAANQRWISISAYDRGSPLVCKQRNDTRWHVAGLLDDIVATEAQPTLQHVKVGSFVNSFVMVELL